MKEYVSQLIALSCITIVLSNTGAFSAPTLAPRKLLEKPIHSVIEQGYDEHTIYVRMREGTNPTSVIADFMNKQSTQIIPGLVGANLVSESRELDSESIERMLTIAENTLSKELADPRQGIYIHLPATAIATNIIDALNASPLVEIAMAAPLPPPPPIPPDYQPQQGYENSSSSGGVGAELFWNDYGITGAGVQVCDVEYDFDHQHCDLPPVQILGFTPVSPYGIDHGTAVLGVVASLDNGTGTTGIAHGADFVKFAGAYDGSTWDVGNAVIRATNAMPTGSIIIIEQQMSGPNGEYVPVEWWQPTYNAIQLAVGNGMIVCEAAGDGDEDLDSVPFSQGNGGHYPFLPENDSGAIIVGAGGSYNTTCGSTWRSKLSFSTYGSRVTLQGWGECVTTTGYGYLWDEENCTYSESFNGTSSATPIVSGACMLLQSYAQAHYGFPLSPDVLRSLLEETGLPQTNPQSGHIGAFPDVVAAIDTLAQPGACCLSSYCTEFSISECSIAGGVFHGTATTCVDGICGTPGSILLVPSEYETIQLAIDASEDGDVIVVAPGTYVGVGDQVVDMQGKSVWLHSSGGATVTVIDGESVRRGVLCDKGETSQTVISGFTIQNGSAPVYDLFGGGVEYSIGAGILCVDSSISIFDCDIKNNSATESTGNQFGAGLFASGFTGSSTITCMGSSIRNNYTQREGGGAFLFEAELILTNCDVSYNTAESTGGGLEFQGGSAFITSSIISNNTANLYDGSAMKTFGGAVPTVSDTIICGNSLQQIAGEWLDAGGNEVVDQCVGSCPDLNNDGIVGVNDLLVIIDKWGTNDAIADLNGDGIVDVGDVLLVIGNWGPCV